VSEVNRFLAARDFLHQHRTDYEAAVSGFTWPEFNEFNWATDYFDKIANNNTKIGLCIVEEDGKEAKLSFSDLSKKSSQLANWLLSNGVAKGDRILLMLGNQVELWLSMLASFKLGAVVIPATTMLTVDDLKGRINRGQVKYVITSNEHIAKFEEIDGNFRKICVGDPCSGWLAFNEYQTASETFEPREPTKSNDPLLLYFTSGTTSLPKLVLHTHQSYPVGHLSTMYWIGLMKNDVHLNISSPGWAKHAWSCFFAPWNAEACIFIYNYSRFNASQMLSVLEKYQVTTMCAPPTVWRMMIQADLQSYKGRLKLRELIGAGEPLNPEVIDQVKAAWGITIRDGFGQTETTAVVGNTPGQIVKPASMGRPLPGYQVKMIDGDGHVVQEGEVSLSLKKRPTGLMVGYFGDEMKTEEVMRGGYYRTGDVAQVDDDGYITYVGRADDVFKASDYRISPFELESAAIEHPAVAEAAVVPSPDPLRLSVPKAFLVLRDGYTPSRELAREIFIFLRNNLAPYKRIRRIEFSDLPKTISGKIRRVELKQLEEKNRTSGTRAEMEFLEEDFPEIK